MLTQPLTADKLPGTVPAGETRDAAQLARDALELTDVGNARRLAARCSGRLLYCAPWGKWLVWADDLEGRWSLDDTGAVVRMAEETIESVHLDALKLGEDQRDRREQLRKHALRSSNAQKIEAMIKLARADHAFWIRPDDFDQDPCVLNLLNGTLHLTDGRATFREHGRQDRLMCQAPVLYQPKTDCPLWRQFLADIFPHDPDLVAFIQELLGYCLTGHVSEHILPILYGTGANGKSTLVSTIQALLGPDYSLTAPRDLLMVHRNHLPHPTVLACLYRRRLVIANESGDGQQLAEALVKQLTGGDRITARRMREDFWEFGPTHKIFLVTNYQPRVKGRDEGIWRRIRLIPFAVRIADDRQDKQLPDKLRGELSGILNWCLEGYRRWARHGLSQPKAVRLATADYATSQDVLGTFLADCCRTGSPEFRCRARLLFQRFIEWCKATNEEFLNQREFKRAMLERGFEHKKSNGWWYHGVALENAAEADDEPPR